MIRRCKQCDLPHFPLTEKVKYCDKCRRKGIKYYKPNDIMKKVCAHCNKEFHTNLSAKIYCGSKCRNLADDRGNKLIKISCKFCGKFFETKKKNKKYCNIKCYKDNKSMEAQSEYKLSKLKRQ